MCIFKKMNFIIWHLRSSFLNKFFFFFLKIICSNLQKGLGSKRQSTGTLCLVEGYFNCSGFSLSETQCNFVTLLFAQSYQSYCSLSHTHLNDV